jgi:hypothetical protein
MRGLYLWKAGETRVVGNQAPPITTQPATV